MAEVKAVSGERLRLRRQALRVQSKYRRIRTAIPVTESVDLLEELRAYESRSMHGQLPVVWERAKDFQVWDRFGNIWIDFTSTIFVTNIGHANPRLKEAVRDILERDLLHSYTFVTEIRVRYLKRLMERMPTQFEKAFLVSTGTEATECAMKLIRLYARSAGKRRGGIVAFEDSMHGRTLGAQMLGGTAAQRAWIGYEDPDIHRLPFPYPWSLGSGEGERQAGAKMFEMAMSRLRSAGVNPETDLGGFLLESYLGWGAIFFPKDYVQALVEFARLHKILVVFDEVQGGFGRTGRFFAYQHYEVEPDLVCCGKGMGSGLPLAAVLGPAAVMDLPEAGSMSSTHSANPLACAAGLATLEELEAKHLVEEAARKGEILLTRLREIQRRFKRHIPYVFGQGLVAGLLIADPVTGSPDAPTARAICERAMQLGLLVVQTGRESIKLGPPLTIPDDALQEGLDVLAQSIEETVR